MLNYLKIKVVSLAAEAKLIRKDERKELERARYCAKNNPGGHGAEYADKHYQLFWGLQYHRKIEVRQEARCANIAYGYLKGRKFSEIEKRSHNNDTNPPNWLRIEEIVWKFSDNKNRADVKAKLDTWRKGEELGMLGRIAKAVGL